jgi:hypothetical protein
VREDVAFVIRTAMPQCGGHPDEQTAVNWFPCRGEYAGYATHDGLEFTRDTKFEILNSNIEARKKSKFLKSKSDTS